MAQRAFLEMLKSATNQPILLLLSGGSSIDLLSDPRLAHALPVNSLLTTLDERLDVGQSNFDRIKQTTFVRACIARKDVEVFDARSFAAENSVTEVARVLDERVYQWMDEYPLAPVMATMGIGLDTHTAGIMPHGDDLGMAHFFQDPKRLFQGYDAGAKSIHRLRVTATFTLLKKVSRAIVFATKEKPIEQVLSSQCNPDHFPARILHQMNSVQLFTNLA